MPLRERGGPTPPHPDPDLSRTPLIHLRAHWGIPLWPPEHIAMIRVESTGRLQVVSADGEVAYRPGPVPEEAVPHLVEVQPGTWVNPRRVKRRPDCVEAPDSTRIPLTRVLPRARRIPPAPKIPGTDLRATDVLWFRGNRRGTGHWRTVDGREVPSPLAIREAQASMPELVRVGGRLVNPRHIRGIQESPQALNKSDSRCRLLLAHGDPLLIHVKDKENLRRWLGIPSLDYVETLVPAQLGLYRLGIRELLPDLRRMTAEQLRTLFEDERTLTANVIWQAFLEHCEGRGTSHRGFWYNPLAVILTRAGFLGRTWSGRVGRQRIDPYRYYCLTLERMVQDYRLFTYEQLGFDDPTPGTGGHRGLQVRVEIRQGLLPSRERDAADLRSRRSARRGCNPSAGPVEPADGFTPDQRFFLGYTLCR